MLIYRTSTWWFFGSLCEKLPEGMSKDLKTAETPTVERSYGWKMLKMCRNTWKVIGFLMNKYPKWSDLFMEIDGPFSSIFWMGSSNDTKTTWITGEYCGPSEKNESRWDCYCRRSWWCQEQPPKLWNFVAALLAAFWKGMSIRRWAMNISKGGRFLQQIPSGKRLHNLTKENHHAING